MGVEAHREVSYMSEDGKPFRVVRVRDPKGKDVLLFEIDLELGRLLDVWYWLSMYVYREKGHPRSVASIRIKDKEGIENIWPQMWRAIVQMAIRHGWVAWWE